MRSGVRAKKHFPISRVDESLYREEIFGIFQGRFTVKVSLECMTSLFIVSSEEKVLRSDRSIEIRVFLTRHEIRHLTSRDVFDDDFQIRVFLCDPLGKRAELSLCSVDESFGNLTMSVSRNRRLRMEREDDATLYHRFEYFSCIFVVGVDISRRSSGVRRDTTRIVLHRTDLSLTGPNDLRSRRRLQRYGHDRGCF
jgi:hypothetical protein